MRSVERSGKGFSDETGAKVAGPVGSKGDENEQVGSGLVGAFVVGCRGRTRPGAGDGRHVEDHLRAVHPLHHGRSERHRHVAERLLQRQAQQHRPRRPGIPRGRQEGDGLLPAQSEDDGDGRGREVLGRQTVGLRFPAD